MKDIFSRKIVELPIRVNIFVLRKSEGNNQFLCIKRVPSDGGFWQTVTGTVHDSESLVDACFREMNEECGIGYENVVNIDGPFYDFEWNKNGVKIREFVYVAEVESNSNVTLEPSEHDNYKWCSADELFSTLEKAENLKAAHIVLEKVI